MSKAQQERIKLFATYLNGLSIGLIITGAVAPSAAVALSSTVTAGPLIYFSVSAFLASLCLHAIAQAVLGVLADDDA